MFAGIDSAIRVWDAKTLKTTYINNFKGNPRKIAVSPDSKYITAGGRNINTIKVVLINLESYKFSEIEFAAKERKSNNIRYLSALSLSNDSVHICIVSNTREIFVYTLKREKSFAAKINIHVSHILFLSKQRLVVAGET